MNRLMRRLGLIALLLVLAALAGGAAMLATWQIPPPTAPVEKVIPDDRFPR
jgi:hypothetical protein